MAKYVTLEGLGYFLEGLRSEKFLASANTLGAIKLGYNDGISEDDLNAEGAAAVSRALNTTNNGNAYVYIGQANDNRFGLVKTNHTASNGTLPVKLDGNGDAYAELNAASSDNIGGIKLGFTNSADGKQSAVQLNDSKAYVEYPYASGSKAGLMSKDDYSKLAGIEAGANNYSLPTATNSTFGGVKTGYGNAADTTHPVKIDGSGNLYTNLAPANSSILGGIKLGYNTTGKKYAVQLDANSKAYVDVPWEGTNYVFGTGLITGGDTTEVIANCDNKTLFAGRNANGYANGDTQYNSLPLQLGQDYEWKNTGDLSNVNDFVEYGIYNLYGERTRSDDNLPIQNTGGGHTFRARLMVYDSSLPDTGNGGNDCCITQVLTLSNRVGGDGNTYIRTGVGSTNSELTWSNWGKMQTNVEVGMIYEGELNNLTDNGMYSGVFFNGSKTSVVKYDGSYFQYTKTFRINNSDFSCFTYIYGQNHMGKSIYIPATSAQWTVGVLTSGHDSSGSGFAPDAKNIDGIDVMANINESSIPSYSYITFVLITVNNYAVASQLGVPSQLSQLLYGIDAAGTFVLKKRTGAKVSNYWSFNAWEDVNSGTGGGISEIPVASSTTLGGIKLDERTQPFVITDQNVLAFAFDGSSLGTGSVTGQNFCKLKVKTATDTTIGGIKTGYTPSTRNYQVKVDNSGNAYTEIGTATADSYGVIKTCGVRTDGSYSYNTGGTTSNRYYGVELDAYGKAFVNVPWTDTKYTLPKATNSALGGVKVNVSAVTNVQESVYGVDLNNNGIAYVDIKGVQSQNVTTALGSDVTLAYNTVHQVTENTQPKVFLPTVIDANRSWHSTLILKNPTSLSLGTGQGWTDSLINEYVFWQNGEKPDFQSSYSTDTYYELLFQTYDTIKFNAGVITQPGKVFISWSKYSK